MKAPRYFSLYPDYEQVTAYNRKDTYRDVKITLLSEGDGRELSELMQELLEQWLKLRTQKSKKSKV